MSCNSLQLFHDLYFFHRCGVKLVRRSKIRSWLLAAIISFAPMQNGMGAPRPEGYRPSQADEAADLEREREQMITLINKAMPLPVTRLSRTVRNGHYVYAVSLDASSVPGIKDGIISFSIELHFDASQQDFSAALAQTAREVRALIAHEREERPIPGTTLKYQ